MPAMSPDLRPLVLPQLVEERKRLEAQHAEVDSAHIYYTTNSSSSDVGSPVTPTFSARGHLRYSSSASSLELASLADSPSSPSQAAHSIKSGHRQLPDVEEEPVERDDVDILDGLYDCLCKTTRTCFIPSANGPSPLANSSAGDEPLCVHRSAPDMLDRPADFDVDYDLGFVSETDLPAAHDRRNVRLGSAESAISGITSRIGSRFPNLSRWAGSRKNSITALSLSEGGDAGGAPCGSSSRASSVSSPLRPNYPHPSEATLSASPRHSFWESTESVVLPADASLGGGSRWGVERDRRLATTPLLPPLLTDSSASAGPLSPGFPFPTPPESYTQTPPQPIPAPSLKTKQSTTSFRLSPTGPDLAIPFPNLLNDDPWSDRLGHANFTILPTPYQPAEPTLPALKQLRLDWDLARVNYTKHLFRTGENYGETSNIYALTQEKWAEVERSWRKAHDLAMEAVIAAAASLPPQSKPRSRSRGRRGRAESSAAALGVPPDEVLAGAEWRRVEDGGPALPRMMSDKFPARGDEDIVGPMVREEVMVRTESVDGRGARLWRNMMRVWGLKR